MSWQLRHEGSPSVLKDLSLQQIVDGLRDGQWETTDEVLGPGDNTWRKIDAHPQLADLAEELMAPSPVRHEEPSSIDMNALIDVCLVLLIFYMITTAYAALVQKTVPLEMTKLDSKGIPVVRIDEAKKKMIFVKAYHENGKPVVLVEKLRLRDVLAADDATIDAGKLRDALAPYVKTDHKTEVLLEAYDISWENTIQIQDGARAAGIQRIRHWKK
jgi:biopolymer transport protein ExbD